MKQRSRQPQSSFTALSAITGIAGVLLGIIAGYILGVGQAGPGASLTAAASMPASPHTETIANEGELQAYRSILASDPKNAKAAMELGNRLYDAGRYTEAIPYYRQALALEPRNVDVSTDLATALYYAGSVDEAIAQLEKSLAIDGTHAQTLYNVGIVKRDGKKDAKGAIEAWERLLQVKPDHFDAAKIRTLITETQQTF
jgi:tetratricopeptide (TPR) repeat protein